MLTAVNLNDPRVAVNFSPAISLMVTPVPLTGVIGVTTGGGVGVVVRMVLAAVGNAADSNCRASNASNIVLDMFVSRLSVLLANAAANIDAVCEILI